MVETATVFRRLAVDDAQLIDRWKQIQTANPLAAVVLITTLSLYCQTIVHNTRSQSVYSLTLAAQVQPVQVNTTVLPHVKITLARRHSYKFGSLSKERYKSDVSRIYLIYTREIEKLNNDKTVGVEVFLLTNCCNFSENLHFIHKKKKIFKKNDERNEQKNKPFKT